MSKKYNYYLLSKKISTYLCLSKAPLRLRSDAANTAEDVGSWGRDPAACLHILKPCVLWQHPRRFPSASSPPDVVFSMSRSQFTVVKDGNGDCLRILVPKGCRLHARQDSFISCSSEVHSRPSKRKLPVPLQEFWADGGDDNFLALSPPFSCSIHLIHRRVEDPPLFFRPHALLAAEDSVIMRKTSCWSNTMEASGPGCVAICAPGSILALTNKNEFGQVASSKVLTCQGIENGFDILKKVSGIGKAKALEGVSASVLVSAVSETTTRKNVKLPASGGISVNEWLRLSSQIFILFVVGALVVLFGESAYDMFADTEIGQQIIQSFRNL